MRQRMARFLSTRRTLLKPGLPEPTVRMSIPVPHIEMMAKGIAPMAKQPSIRRSRS
jgi:hypothetical protein